jgi:hypothetical protein
VKTKLNKAAIANAWLTNPATVWILLAVVAGAGALWLVPGLYDGARKGFDRWVDDILAGASSIVGAPASQVPSERTAADSVKGVFTTGDRALSDWYDWTIGRVL